MRFKPSKDRYKLLVYDEDRFIRQSFQTLKGSLQTAQEL